MKRWFVKLEWNKEILICSLMSMDARSKSCVLLADSGERFQVMFNPHRRYEFAKAKSGFEVEAKAMLKMYGYKCKIVFT